MSRDNPTWGAPRIHGELLKLAIHVSESSVAKYMVRHPKPPSQTWRTFLSNHASQLVSVDFFTVPTISFHILYAFIVLSHNRRHILHFNVTAHPTAKWTSQQIVEAFPSTARPGICCGITIKSTDANSVANSKLWGSAKSGPRSDPPGKMHSSNASLAPFAESVWTI